MDVRISQADLNALATLITSKPPEVGIDTSALVTMLGFAAAVWAVVPNTARLKLRLSLSLFDWAIIALAILVINVLFFEEPLRALGLYPVLGPWSWGFDKAITQYTLFLASVLLIAYRSLRTRLSPRRLPVFEKLASELLYARKFEELTDLLEHHLCAILDIANGKTKLGRLEAWLRPKFVWSPPVFLKDGKVILVDKPDPSFLRGAANAVRGWLADRLAPSKARQSAQAIARMTLSSHGLISYMALTKPYLCTRVMAQATFLVDEFQDEFFVALLANEASVLYAELKNNENRDVGRKYRLPEENELLRFYLHDVRNAGTLGVFKSLGNAVISRIESDDGLIAKLNGPRLDYQEKGSRRCPVYVGIHFFDIMVQQGLHQRSDDHLWLHYFRHFTDHLLRRARPPVPEDETQEFATPLGYLLYALVDATSHWISEAARLTDQGDTIFEDDVTSACHVYISFEAAEALGGMMELILSSEKVPERLKKELLDIVLHVFKELNRHQHLAPLSRVVASSLVRPYGFSQTEYREILREYFRQADASLTVHAHVLRSALDSGGDIL